MVLKCSFYIFLCFNASDAVPVRRTNIFASFGLRMKFKTLFMSDEEKHGHHFDLPIFFNVSKQFLAPGGFSAECVQVSVTHGER